MLPLIAAAAYFAFILADMPCLLIRCRLPPMMLPLRRAYATLPDADAAAVICRRYFSRDFFFMPYVFFTPRYAAWSSSGAGVEA